MHTRWLDLSTLFYLHKVSTLKYILSKILILINTSHVNPDAVRLSLLGDSNFY